MEDKVWSLYNHEKAAQYDGLTFKEAKAIIMILTPEDRLNWFAFKMSWPDWKPLKDCLELVTFSSVSHSQIPYEAPPVPQFKQKNSGQKSKSGKGNNKKNKKVHHHNSQKVMKIEKPEPAPNQNDLSRFEATYCDVNAMAKPKRAVVEDEGDEFTITEMFENPDYRAEEEQSNKKPPEKVRKVKEPSFVDPNYSGDQSIKVKRKNASLFDEGYDGAETSKLKRNKSPFNPNSDYEGDATAKMKRAGRMIHERDYEDGTKSDYDDRTKGNYEATQTNLTKTISPPEGMKGVTNIFESIELEDDPQDYRKSETKTLKLDEKGSGIRNLAELEKQDAQANNKRSKTGSKNKSKNKKKAQPTIELPDIENTSSINVTKTGMQQSPEYSNDDGYQDDISELSKRSNIDLSLLNSKDKDEALEHMRRFKRYKVDLHVEILGRQQRFASKTVDISLGGIQIEDSIPDWVAGYCTVLISTPDLEHRLEFMCSVVENQGGDRMRLEIYPSSDTVTLRKWLEQGLPGGSKKSNKKVS